MSSAPFPKRLLKQPDVLKKIEARSDDLLSALIDLALGHYVTIAKFNRLTGQVETRVYAQPPDYKALAFLMENVIGKVPNRLEITGEDGGPVKIVPYMSMPEAIRVGIIESAQREQKQLGAGEDEDEDEDAIEAEEAEYEELPAGTPVGMQEAFDPERDAPLVNPAFIPTQTGGDANE